MNTAFFLATGGGGKVSVPVPGIHLSEAVWLLIAMGVLVLYVVQRLGTPFYHAIALIVLGALSAGLWPTLGGKLADWGAAGQSEHVIVYIILAICTLGVIGFSERSLRRRPPQG